MTNREIIQFVNDPIAYVKHDVRNGNGWKWIFRLALGALAGIAFLAGMHCWVFLLTTIL